MKTVKLHDMGVAPLTEMECQKVNGGVVWWVPVAIMAGVTFINSAMTHFQDIRQGFDDGWNGKAPRHSN
jgi:hypothetical protein